MKRLISALTILLVSCLTVPSAVYGQPNSNTLHDVSKDEKTTSLDRVTRLGQRERLVRIRFTDNEPFVFVMPESLLHNLDPRSNPLFASNGVMYVHFDSRFGNAPIPYFLPNHLLRIRAALLSAERYFSTAARNLQMTYVKLPSPTLIYLGYGKPFAATYSDVKRGSRSFNSRFDYRIPPRMLEVVAVHEFFHTLHANLFPDNEDYREYLRESDTRARKFLNDITCEWSSDEPIVLNPRVQGAPRSVDEINAWHWETGVEFLQQPMTRKMFIYRGNNRYHSGILAKYLSEQLAGGRDNQGVKHIFDLHQRVFQKKKATPETIRQSIGETLPARYGNTPDERFTQFWRDFACANLVLKASPGHSPAQILGYHDDGVQSLVTTRVHSRLTAAPPVNGVASANAPTKVVAKIWTDEFSKMPAMAHGRPAQTDQERKTRLAALAVGSSGPGLELEPYTNSWQLIDLSGATSASQQVNFWMDLRRPIFIYVKADQAVSAEVASLAQKTLSGDHRDRQTSTFTRSALSLQSAASRTSDSFVMHETSDAAFHWIGCVNAHQSQKRKYDVAYIASPRLVRHPDSGWPGSEKVKLVQSPNPTAVHVRQGRQIFFNGDEFELSVLTSGPVHVRNPSGPIPASNRTIQCELLTVNGDEPVGLAGPIKVTLENTLYSGQRYRFTGKIADDNQKTGMVKARITLTSLLNLGGQDREIDESFTFSLSNRLPVVESVVARSNNGSAATVVYDSRTLQTAAVLPNSDGNYQVQLDIKFSEPMKPATVTVKSGVAQPYHQINTTQPAWSENNTRLKANLSIPKSTLTSSAAIAYLTIAGTSVNDGTLDSDPLTPGPQPDRSHFLLLEFDEFYELVLRAESKTFASDIPDPRHAKYQGDAHYRPLELKIKLVPIQEYPKYPSRVGPAWAKRWPLLMKQVKKGIAACNEQIKFNEDRLKGFRGKPGAELYESSIREATAEKTKLLAALKKLQDLQQVVDALVRISNGFTEYRYLPEISGNIRGKFAGATWREESIYGQETRTGEVTAPRWTTDNFPQDKNALRDLKLFSWRIHKQDAKTINDYLSDPPADPVTHDYGFTDLKREICRVVRAMWLCSTPTDSLPEIMGTRTQGGDSLYDAVQPNSTQVIRLPTLTGAAEVRHLCRFNFNVDMLSRFPLTGSGTYRVVEVIDGVVTRREQHAVKLTKDGKNYADETGKQHAEFDWIFSTDYRLRDGGTRTHLTTGSVDTLGEWSGTNLYVFDYFRHGRPVNGTEFVRNLDSNWTKKRTRHDFYHWQLRINGDGALAGREDRAGDAPVPQPPTPPDTTNPPSGPGSIVVHIQPVSGVSNSGQVAVYLDGGRLPPGTGNHPPVLLASTTDTLRVVPVGGRLNVVNNDSKPHTIRSAALGIPARQLAANGSYSIQATFPATIRLRDQQQPGRRIQVVVAPNKFCQTAGPSSTITFHGVPAGKYTLHVVPANPKLRRNVYEVDVPPNGLAGIAVNANVR